ncbi:MAG: LysR family transcriptional regulator [Rhodospirillaceae bacterium]|nr:LysR family transcriptional regulator [Rhodospirillaceae bacterium]
MNSRMANLRHLRAFAAVARCRSISKASQVVHLSQPAVTQAIANLEERLGAPLFERRSDGMVSTDAGTLFLDRVERALALIQAGARTAVQLAARKGGRGNAKFDQLLTAAQLRALIAVSKAENFSLAARQAGISQPTVHRAARDIERLSGLALFTKSSQGIALTPSADALAQAAKLAFAELEQGFAEIDEMLGVDAGRIVIGTLPLPRTFILPTAINALLARRPDVRVSVVDGPYNDLLRDLRHGDVDLLVGALRNPVPIDDVVQETLFSDPLAVVGRAGHPLAGRSGIGLADLAAYPWVVPRQGTPTRAMFDRLFEGATPPACPVESSSLVLIRGLLTESDHLTLISAHQIRHEERAGVLAPLPFDMSATSRPIGITHRRDWRPTATQRDFLTCVRAAGRAVGGT